jgi:hypothetical protein
MGYEEIRGNTYRNLRNLRGNIGGIILFYFILFFSFFAIVISISYFGAFIGTKKKFF